MPKKFEMPFFIIITQHNSPNYLDLSNLDMLINDLYSNNFNSIKYFHYNKVKEFILGCIKNNYKSHKN